MRKSKFLSIFILLFVGLSALRVTAQVPLQFKYQAALRDAGGAVMANQNKTVVIDILQSSPAGTSIFNESHDVTTSALGLISLNIGSVNSLSGINWSASEYFLQITVDGTVMGVSQLLSVPYALNAQFAETADYNSLSNLPILNSANWNTAYGWGNHASAGYLTSFTEVDGSTTNELQTLSVSGDQLSISSGNSVTLPTGTTYTAGTGIGISGGVISNTGDADNNISNEIQTLSVNSDQLSISGGNSVTLPTGTTYTAGTGIGISGGVISNTGDADNNISNELQTLSVSGDQLSISSGNSVTLPTGTTYTAGTGISISGGVISNTGDTDASNDFSGNYEELAGTPVNFYIAGSGDYPTSITNNVYRDGGFALGFNNPTEGKLDVRQSGSGTTNADLTGLYVKNSNTSTSALYGVKSDMPSNATGLQTAYYSYVSGTGSGAHRGLYNYLTGAGTGIQAANYSLIDNSGNNIHYGNYSELSGGGSGLHYGNYLVISGTGTSDQFGENILISNSGNASHIGLRNTLSGSGSGLHIGTDNNLTGLGTGIQYGVKNTVDNSNTNTHYGVYNTLTGTGNGSRYGVYNTLTGTGGGSHYGTYNTLSGAGTGDQYGVQSSISNTGNGIHYAFRTDLSGTGSGTHLAMYNTISGSGAGNQYGVKTEITNSSTGIHYGNYASLSGSGSGSKYGTFNKIESTAGGTHYAVYGNATKAGSYAGYFVGDVNVSEKVLSDDSGDADMKAYIYGKITGTSSGASIVSTASSGGFSITRAAEGEYNVTFTNSPGSSSAYIVMTSFDRLEGYNPAISTVNYSSYFKIYTEVQTGLGGLVSHDFNFSFVVYKK